jgi:hypothetical protein
MSTVSTLKTNILYDLSDTSQNNYADAEIWMQMNKAIRFISRELMKGEFKTFVASSTAVIAADDNDKALASDFLAFAVDESGNPKVFNQTNSYTRMGQAKESDIDDWEKETSADVGTPDEFYTRALTLYVHPWATVETTVKYYYHKLESITNDASTVPWNAFFDDAIERYVVFALRTRDERTDMVQMDTFLFDTLKKEVLDILYKREGFNFNIAPGHGWDA